MRTALLAAALSAAVCATGAAGGEPGEWTKLFEAPTEQVGPRAFCKPLLLPGGRLLVWGGPGKAAARDWNAGFLDLAAGEWKPLVPRGKEDWLKARPKMTYWMRWGTGGKLETADGLLQPVPVQHFNQAAYVPTLKKVLYVIGDKSLLLDPETGLWEEFKPKARPPLVLWSALEYDPVNDEVVLFGGGACCAENHPGTWLFSAKDLDWRKLDQPLAEQPPARCNAPLAYDSKNRLIAVFGGDAQDRYLSDTWVYDCAKRRWRELKTNVRPFPRSAPALCFLGKHGVFMMGGAIPTVSLGPTSWVRSRGSFGEETWILDAAAATWTRVAGKFPAADWTGAVYDAERDRVVLHRVDGQWAKQVQFHAWKPSLAAAGEGTPDPGKLVGKYLPPEWYTQGLEPFDESAGEKFIKGLKPNEWAAVNPLRDGMIRTWGSAAIDTDRHEVLYWGGGHCGYCGTDVSHFSLKTLHWTIGFPPELPPAPYSGFYGDESSFLIACRSFRGRPWVQHGRVSYAYDPAAKLFAFTQSISEVPTRGWTYVYDPAKKDFVDVFEQPFIGGWAVSGLAVSTPHGVFDYLSPGDHPTKEVGLFQLDMKARKWTNLTGGKATAPSCERDRVVYDSKRDRLVLLSRDGGGKDANPAMYAWDFKGGAKDWTKLEMTGEPPAGFYRECVYVAKHDRILSLRGDGLYACDLAAGNRWTKPGPGLPPGIKGVGPSTFLGYDPGMDVLVLFPGGNIGPVGVWLMRYEPAPK